MIPTDVAGTVYLKRKHARPVLRRHPWIFSGAVARVEGHPADGDVVDVRDAGGNWLARGTINRRSQIPVRLLTWQPEEAIDDTFWRRRLTQAVAARRSPAASTTAYRLVHAESDFLPGLIVDRYGEWLAVQFLTLGVERRRATLTATLAEVVDDVRGIYERSDVDVRLKEGLKPRTGLLWGEKPPASILVQENDLRFSADIRRGHKTGLYLDQRENRARLSPFCTGAEVLDAFAYTGGFGVYAARAGAAHVTLVDSAVAALDRARQNFALNGITTPVEYVTGDVFGVLRGYRAQGRQFDLVILDPPKFAPARRDVQRAARAYKDINLLAFRLLRPGGTLFTFSCSGAISADLFQKIVFGAAVDAGRDAQIIGYLAQGSDHPVALTFPEGAYLKGLICRVL